MKGELATGIVYFNGIHCSNGITPAPVGRPADKHHRMIQFLAKASPLRNRVTFGEMGTADQQGDIPQVVRLRDIPFRNRFLFPDAEIKPASIIINT
jgi:hypothetical protein